MPKRDDKDSISETGNWNVAKAYSSLKIMGPLFLADEYYDIAVFGTSDFVEGLDHYVNLIPVDILKQEGFKRLVHTLIKVIGNSKFAIKNPKDLKTLEGYEKKLEKIDNIKHLIFKELYSQRTKIKTVKIDEPKYKKILKEIKDIKDNINTPLNKSHLIFTDKEDFDPEAYKKLIMKNAVSMG